LCPASKSDEGYEEDVCAALSTGLGPAIGALVAMFIFKRKTEYTLLGKSAWKSIATIVIPCIVFGIIGGWDLGVTCLAAFHGIANFSKRDLFSDTTFTVAFVCVIVFWIVMWYFVGVSPKQQGRTHKVSDTL
jgi:hypothetical protein